MQLVVEECSRPFDLDRQPPFGITVIQCGSSCCIMVVAIHHIISDGWSVTIMLSELAKVRRCWGPGGAECGQPVLVEVSLRGEGGVTMVPWESVEWPRACRVGPLIILALDGFWRGALVVC